ncbi:FIG043197: Inositol monophosphatase family protein [hydrothermal vent metagenome]|uniref:FIG043197: Inositol monophosphatase family protein n=1 Tax=hydrothermal vent metagenome TaxID=652676 RepID=A0A3B0U7J0_9ZZZZ
MPAPDLARDFALAEAAVREAGTLARAHFHAAPKIWTKEDDSPVSEADKAVDRLLLGRLTGPRPGYGWLSEETADAPTRLTRSCVWIVDPIDGTRAYLNGHREWVISVALVQDGAPVLGLIYNPMHEQMFTAIAGGGARLNGRPIAVSATPRMEGCRLLANAGQMKNRRWTAPWPQMDVQRYNALAYRIAMVAMGRYDATLTFSRFHEWDVAAADLILTEAGGALTTFEGERFVYNQATPRLKSGVAANPVLAAAFVAFIARSGKD